MTITRKGTTARWSETSSFNQTVYLSGQLADDTSGDFAAQMRETLSNCSKALAMGNSDRSRILSAAIYLKDMAHLPEMNAAWDDWLPIGAAPCRTTVRADMVDGRCLVEITLIAAER